LTDISPWLDLQTKDRFDRMKERADELAPDVGIRRNNQDFFHRGYAGQWRDLLDDESAPLRA
jgi:hypothetical protein